MIGANALWLFYVWLICAAAAGWLSERKGFGDKPGLATGLILFVLAPFIWLAIPAKPESKWRRDGPFPKRRQAPGAILGDGEQSMGAESPQSRSRQDAGGTGQNGS